MRRLVFSAGLTTILAIACGSDEPASPTPDVPPLFSSRKADESVKAPGLSARVEIARDEFGVPHIYAKTTSDAALCSKATRPA